MTTADGNNVYGNMLSYQTRMAENERCFYKNFDKLTDELYGNGAGEAILDRRMNDFVPLLFPPLRGPLRGDSYWRGVVAIFLATPEGMELPALKDQQAFIEWAGKHNDVKTIIDVALERKTYNVETLRFLVEENGSHKAVREGAL